MIKEIENDKIRQQIGTNNSYYYFFLPVIDIIARFFALSWEFI